MRIAWAALVCAGSLVGALPVAARPASAAPTPRQQARAFFEDGARKQAAGDYIGAIRAYDVSLAQDAQQAEALSQRGFCYQQLRQYAKALADYTAALQLKPKLAEAHASRGAVFVALGRLDEARQEYETLLKLNRAAASALKQQIDAATPGPTPTDLNP